MRERNNSVCYQHGALYEYALVVHPDAAVVEKIMDEKRLFHSHYAHTRVSKMKPHITIAHFLAKDIMEETLIRWIQNICHLQRGFQLSLNNFSGIPPDSIYVRVQEPSPLIHLANAMKMIDGFIQSNDCPPLQTISRPHLMIAANLPEHVYNNAIGDYAAKSFNATFTVDKLELLKMESGFDRCEVVNRFPLSQSVASN
ncbi:MAG: 2'-5' RNA ligase family protein [Flavisolibacter sp.]